MAPEHFTGILTHLYTLKDLAPCKLRYVRIGSCTIQLRTSASLQVIKLVSRCKTILQGTVKGGRRQGRQKRRWEDNTREWTGLGFTKSRRAVEKWRKLVVKSFVVPQRPP